MQFKYCNSDRGIVGDRRIFSPKRLRITLSLVLLFRDWGNTALATESVDIRKFWLIYRRLSLYL